MGYISEYLSSTETRIKVSKRVNQVLIQFVILPQEPGGYLVTATIDRRDTYSNLENTP